MSRPRRRNKDTDAKLDRVPGPFTRFRRRHLRIVALSLIGLVLVAASFMQSTSAELLKQTLDANWRGDYDILVTAGGSTPLVDGESTLLSSSALTNAALGHIPSGQVAQVEGLDGIDVAAPIGEISTPTTGTSKVTLIVPLDNSNPGPRAYRATTQLSIDDGVTAPRTINGSVDFVVDQTQWEGFRQLADGEHVRIRASTTDGGTYAPAETDPNVGIDYYYSGYSSPRQPPPGEGIVMITLPVPAVETAHIVLVDAEAEKRLLGDAGDVMDPLIDTTSLIGTLGTNVYDPTDPDDRPVDGDDLQTLSEKGIVSNAAPVLTRTVETSPSALTVQLAPLDVPPSTLSGALTWNQTGDNSMLPPGPIEGATAGDAQTIYTGDPGDALSPLTFDTVDINWPGFTMPEQPSYARFPYFRPSESNILSMVTPMADSSVQPTTSTASIPDATGATDAHGAAPQVSLQSTSNDAGELQFNALSPILDRNSQPLDTVESEIWPVGSFTPQSLRGESTSLGQVGLGYDDPDPTVTNGSEQQILPPSWSGLGLNTSGALAIADLENASSWHVTDPVSSIRVRVAGIDGYTADAQARILDVANRIRDLGLTATVVSGSSLEAVPVSLLPPADETQGTEATDDSAQNAPTPEADERTAAPVVTLEYSRLGAAALASGGVSGTNLALLVMAIVAGTALLVAVQLSSIAARRTDSVVLRQIGWPRARIRRWLVAEEAIPLAILIVVGAATIALSAVREVTIPMVIISLGASLLTSALLIQRGAHPAAPPRLGHDAARAGKLRTPSRLGLRQAATSPATTVTLALAFTLVYLAAATAIAVLLTGRQAAGTSRLGAFATAQALVPQGILITVTIVASCVLIVVVRRLGLERRTAQLEALHAMGWQRTHLRKTAIAEVLSSAAPGLLAGAVFAVIGSVLLSPTAVLPAAGAGALTTIVVTAVVVRSSLRRR
ncbi:ABC transporter permease [Agreia pratensis]|uniref:FtsX-like permease family protein n=1 Tax=Agreia pratensis TaxID=150121 RepID=A0A1X7KTB2_9MICO|nr:FtsX-like permease family protein [Agreia pratensis]SMG44442.1 hypothetical protein SAMN06296010_2877 [Agreia pratensis]